MQFKPLYQSVLTTSNQVEEFEHTIGARLPEDYRQHLLTQLGGHPTPSTFRVEWQGQSWSNGYVVNSIAWLFAIHKGTHENLASYYHTHLDRIPFDTISIGRDPGSNLLLLAVKGKNVGKVYFWLREYENDMCNGESPGYDNVGYVAESFSSLMNSLTEP